MDLQKKKKSIRCALCHKKISLINFTCQCNQIFCSIHRYSHSHDCSFTKEKNENSKKTIESKNPRVDHSKVQKI